MLNVAVIGANGFIGFHLINELCQVSNINVFLFGRAANKQTTVHVPYFQIDLMDTEQLKKQFTHIDVVYYLASATIPTTSWENPVIEFQNNLLPFVTFTDCVAKLGIKKIIFVSSAGTIYGPSKVKVTEDTDKQPFSPYGIIKLTIEHFLNYFKAKYNVSFDIYRVSNVYGEGQNTTKGLGIINTFIENVLSKNEIHIFGDGENLRNYVYVKDVAKLLSSSIQKDLSVSQTYYLSSNDTISINQLVAILKQEILESFTVNYENKRQSDNSFIDLDNSKIIKDHHSFQFTPIQLGIKATYEHIKKNI